MSAPRRRLALALLPAFAACTPPIQSGGVDVREGAARRLGMVCRYRHGAVRGDNPCASSEEHAAPSRVGASKKESDKLSGKESDKLSGPFAAGRAGDDLIDNDEVAVVMARRLVSVPWESHLRGESPHLSLATAPMASHGMADVAYRPVNQPGRYELTVNDLVPPMEDRAPAD